MLNITQFREAKFKADRVGYALRGENPTMIARMNSGFVFMSDTQFLPGWCILTAYPQVGDLTDLPFERRNDFLADMNILGEAILAATQPVRINYAILGNTDHYLHAHVHPRYAWEDPERLRKPAYLYPNEYFSSPAYALNESHLELAQRIATKLDELRHGYGR